MSKARTFIYALALLAVIISINYKNLNGYFVQDDLTIIHRTYNKGPFYFLKAFFNEFTKEMWPRYKEQWQGRGFIRPILLLSFKLNFLISGVDPLSYHLTNLLLHFFNSLLVFLMIKFITMDEVLSFIGALLFAVHPAHSGSLSWISARELAPFFYLLSFYLFINFRCKNSKGLYFLSILSFPLGFLARRA